MKIFIAFFSVLMLGASSILNAAEVTVSGIGSNRSIALQEAFKEAVRQGIGTYIESSTIVRNDEIIKNLTKTSAEECNSLFQSIGANTYCCNFLGDKI